MGQSALNSFDFEKFCGKVEALTSGSNGVFTDEKLHEIGAQYIDERQKRLQQATGQVLVVAEVEVT